MSTGVALLLERDPVADDSCVQAALAEMTLASLLARNALTQPDALALAGSLQAESWTFASLDARVCHVAARLRALELSDGETVLVTGGASPYVLIAMLAALRAGLGTALAPLAFGPAGLAAACVASSAVALIGAGDYRFGDFADVLAATAAAAPEVRLVATCGDEGASGFVNLDEPGEAAACEASTTHSIVTFIRDTSGMTAVAHDTSVVAVTALAFQQALPDDGLPVLSTIAPVTLAGIACGPMAAWLGGRGLYLHGPFDSAVFAQDLRQAGRAHGIVPATGAAGFLAYDPLARAFASLTLLHRHADAQALARACPQHLAHAGEVALFDLHSFGETLALALPRNAQGQAQAVAGAARHIHINGAASLAFETRRARDGGLDMRGAISGNDRDWRPL